MAQPYVGKSFEPNNWIAAALLIPYGFFAHLGIMAGVLGLGDLLIGLAYLFALPGVISKRPTDLLDEAPR
jgi:hypothetical protein